jgi:hypothetical protein
LPRRRNPQKILAKGNAKTHQLNQTKPPHYTYTGSTKTTHTNSVRHQVPNQAASSPAPKPEFASPPTQSHTGRPRREPTGCETAGQNRKGRGAAPIGRGVGGAALTSSQRARAAAGNAERISREAAAPIGAKGDEGGALATRLAFPLSPLCCPLAGWLPFRGQRRRQNRVTTDEKRERG